MSFSLVRQDGEVSAGDTLAFREGDSFHARVTCPPGSALEVGIAAFAGNDVDVPVASQVTCGNEIDVPGAFSLTGRDVMHICLVYDLAEAITESRLRSGHAGYAMLCKAASPVRD
jgi:hypothetical protein